MPYSNWKLHNFNADSFLVVLWLQNKIFGFVPGASLSWSALQQTIQPGLANPPTWPRSLAVLSLANNPSISGTLPPAGEGYLALTSMDWSNTSVSGPIPESWSNLVALKSLNLKATQISCNLVQQADASV
jgi:hypothetical protein